VKIFPYCTAEIAVEAKKCKLCGEWVERGDPNHASEPVEPKLTVQPPTRGPSKTCPYCSARIPEDAWTCLYCQRGVIGGGPLAVGLTVVGLLIAAVFFFGSWLPGFREMKQKHEEMKQKHEEFDREFLKRRREIEQKHKGFDKRWNELPGR
jgi:hypothetical protein